MLKLEKWKQVVYSAGNGGFSILDNIFGIYFMYFLLPPKETGLPELIFNESLFFGVTVIGLIIIFGRLVDSISDPLIAFWSDRNKSRLGRRRFFLLTGAFPFALSAVLLFTLPDKTGTTLNAVYAAITLGLYFFFYTYYMAPYLALIPELTHTHEDRIFITVIQAFFMLIGAAIVMMGVPIIWEGIEHSGVQKSEAFVYSIITVAVVGFLVSFIAALVVDEKKYTRGEPADVPLIQSIKMTLANKAFMLYMIPVILFWFTFHIIRSTVAYYPVVLLHKDPSFQTILMVELFGGAALFFLLISALSKKVSNKVFMSSGLLAFAIFLIPTFFIDTFGENGVIVAGIQMFLLGYPVAILMVIPNAILSDIAEVDGDATGLRREAMFFGTQGLFMKVNYGIASAILAGLFALFGKDVANPLGVKISGPVAAAFSFIGFLAFMAYPQDAITEKLKKIRGK